MAAEFTEGPFHVLAVYIRVVLLESVIRSQEFTSVESLESDLQCSCWGGSEPGFLQLHCCDLLHLVLK